MLSNDEEKVLIFLVVQVMGVVYILFRFLTI